MRSYVFVIILVCVEGKIYYYIIRFDLSFIYGRLSCTADSSWPREGPIKAYPNQIPFFVTELFLEIINK